MKYETPELTALSAVNAIQNSTGSKNSVTFPRDGVIPGAHLNEPGHGYADWE